MAGVRSKPSNMYFSLYKPQLQKVELKEIKTWIRSRCTLTPWGCGPASQEAPARLKSPVSLCMKDETWTRTYLLSEERSPSGGTWLEEGAAVKWAEPGFATSRGEVRQDMTKNEVMQTRNEMRSACVTRRDVRKQRAETRWITVKIEERGRGDSKNGLISDHKGTGV